MSDIDMKSRIKAYITNNNYPWESKITTHLWAGAFFVFKVLFNTDKKFKIEKVYTKSFAQQIACIL